MCLPESNIQSIRHNKQQGGYVTSESITVTQNGDLFMMNKHHNDIAVTCGGVLLMYANLKCCAEIPKPRRIPVPFSFYRSLWNKTNIRQNYIQ